MNHLTFGNISCFVVLSTEAIFGQGLDPASLLKLDGSNAGVSSLGFLKLPVSARNIGLASATLTTDEEATVIQSSPGGLAYIHDYYYSLSHAEILGEFRHENMAFTFPTERFGTVGGSANILATTTFSEARDIDETPTAPSAYDLALGLAYAKTMFEDRVSLGSRVDFIKSSLDGTSAMGYGVNVGLMFMLVRDFRLAMVLKNISSGIHYQSQTAPVEPLPLSFGMELGKPLLNTNWSAHLGMVQSNEGLLHYYGGLEWAVIKFLILRMGYDGAAEDRELGTYAGLGMGMGIKYDRFTFDYGFKTLGPLGAYHAFTLNYSRKAKFRPRDEILLEQAEEKYREGNYTSALRLTRGAIALNPYNFKAQALAQKLQFDLDQVNESAITFYYTANTDGHIAASWKDGKSIGGLARRKTKLLELKGSPGKNIFLDAGNLTKPGSKLKQEKYVYESYAQMPYDMINIGTAELSLPKETVDARLPFLNSQKPLNETPRVKLTEKTYSLKRGTQLRMLGVVAPNKARDLAQTGKELEAITEAIKRHSGAPGKKKILIVMMTGNLLSAHKLAQQIPELDAIFLSGEAQTLGSPLRSGKTLICSPGLSGLNVGNLTLLLNNKGEIRSFKHFLIPLEASIPEDAELARFLSPVTVDPNKFNFDGFDDDYHAQIFSFTRSSDKEKTGKLYLRDLRNELNYLIPTGSLNCSQPILGYGKNKIAWIGEDSTGTREIYAFAPGLNASMSSSLKTGVDSLDTLTHMGGKALSIKWILHSNAILSVYEKGETSELYRLDPWSHQVRDLSQGKFGLVQGFDITKAGDRLILNAFDGRKSNLWVTDAELSSPVKVVSDQFIVGAPKWNPAGDKMAFLISSQNTALSDTDLALGTPISGELRVFDFTEKKLISATQQSRVRQFNWSADGKKVFYSAGVNLADLNQFHLDSMSLSKVTTQKPSPRTEENPIAKMWNKRDGILFEAEADSTRKIIWMDLGTKFESEFVDSVGYNRLR